jgi:hypothetical protein
MTHRYVLPVIAFFIGLASYATSAHAEVFRAVVTVDTPAGMPSQLAANRAVDTAAKSGLVEAYLQQRLSPVLLSRRGDEVRTALDPLNELLDGFTVVSRTSASGGTRVVCEADIDTAGVVRRLVENRVMSFGTTSPRLLMLPAPGTSPELMSSLRLRMTDQLRGLGIEVLAAETLSHDASTARSAADASRAMAEAAVDAGAHFVAVVRVAGTPAPAPAGLSVLDGSAGFTLLRSHDAAILGERAFTSREGGSSPQQALQRVFDVVGAPLARSLGGEIARAVFSNGHVVDTALQPGRVVISVQSRPSAASTAAFVDFLRGRGFRAALGSGALATDGHVAADSVVIDGRSTVEELFMLLATSHFGANDSLTASIFEHGAETLKLEIVDGSTPVQHPPVTFDAAASIQTSAGTGASSVTSTNEPVVSGGVSVAAGAAATGSASGGTSAAGTRRPSPSVPNAGGRSAVPGSGALGTTTRSPASVARTPLEFEFSEIMQVAVKAGK